MKPEMDLMPQVVKLFYPVIGNTEYKYQTFILLKMENKDPFIESMKLTVKTRQEVADEYGTSVKTLVSRLRGNGVVLPHGNIFPKTIKVIYYTLGVPAGLKTEFIEGKEYEKLHQ